MCDAQRLARKEVEARTLDARGGACYAIEHNAPSARSRVARNPENRRPADSTVSSVDGGPEYPEYPETHTYIT